MRREAIGKQQLALSGPRVLAKRGPALAIDLEFHRQHDVDTAQAEVACRLGTSRTTGRLWLRHWLARPGDAVAARLQDAPRPGAPTTCRAEQGCQSSALACEPPEASGRPISHWTPREVASEAITRGIVETISERHVGRFFKSGRSEAAPQSLLAQCGTR